MVDANSISYEKFELNGEQHWGTGALIDPQTVPDGLYCYHVFKVLEGDISGENEFFIAKEEMKGEPCGSILSLTPFDFQEEAGISLKSIRWLDHECLQTLDNILEQAGLDTIQEGMDMTGI